MASTSYLPFSEVSTHKYMQGKKVQALVALSCLTLHDLMDYSPTGSSIHGILQARILEWVAIPFSRGSSQSRDRSQVSCIAGQIFTIRPTRDLSKIMYLHVILNLGGSFELNFLFFSSMLSIHTLIGMISSVMCCAQSLSCVQLFVTPWTRAHQVPLSMGIIQAKILEWVAIPSSRGSFQPRDQICVFCIAGGFLTIWVTREAPPQL